MNKRISNIVTSRRASTPVFILLVALLLGVSACGPAASSSTGSQTTSVPQGGNPASQVGAPPTSPAVPAAKRDVNSMNACALFPGAAVASALNTSLADPTNTGAGFGADCTYFLSPTGTSTGNGQLYNLFLLDPVLFDPSLSALENPQPVAGLGDKAFMGTRVGTTVKDLMVLKAGDIFIEINGDDATMLQKLAEYILANLP